MKKLTCIFIFAMLTLVACNTPSLATQKAETVTATIAPTKETSTDRQQTPLCAVKR
jgi:hypothetical protein